MFVKLYKCAYTNCKPVLTYTIINFNKLPRYRSLFICLIVHYLYSLKLLKTYSIKIGSYEREKESKHQGH